MWPAVSRGGAGYDEIDAQGANEDEFDRQLDILREMGAYIIGLPSTGPLDTIAKLMVITLNGAVIADEIRDADKVSAEAVAWLSLELVGLTDQFTAEEGLAGLFEVFISKRNTAAYLDAEWHGRTGVTRPPSVSVDVYVSEVMVLIGMSPGLSDPERYQFSLEPQPIRAPEPEIIGRWRSAIKTIRTIDEEQIVRLAEALAR